MPMNNVVTNMFGAIFLVYVIIGFVVPFMLIYILGFVRRQRDDGQSDNMLGAKVFLTLLMSVSFQIIVFGVYRLIAVTMGDAPANAPSFSSGSVHGPYDMALGLLYGGGVAAIYPTLVYFLVRFRQKASDPVFHSALGVNAIFTGLVFVVAVTMLMVTTMTTDTDPTEAIAITFAYLMASLLCGVPLALGSPIKSCVQAKPCCDTPDPSTTDGGII